MQSPPKPQFASWLIKQVEAGQYEGLRFVGENRFRVPWKHNSRRDLNDEDCRIFRAWAEVSGKIHVFPNNKARWKTNFRSALNMLSRHFKMVVDNSKNQDDPHKIYEIVNTEFNCGRLSTQTSQSESDRSPEIYFSPVDFPSPAQENLLNSFRVLDLGTPLEEEEMWADSYIVPDPSFPATYPGEAEIPLQVLPDTQPTYSQPQTDNLGHPNLGDLEISIYYRKKEMLKTTMRVSRLQLHYNHPARELNAYSLCFPSTEGLLDRKQIEYTNRILSSVERGLLLEVRESGIFATRQDKCHVFASTEDPTVASPNPEKLPQSTTVPLLNFSKYGQELKDFKDNNGKSPNYTINMCFGEKFPDGKPLEKKLVVVKVVPLICRYFHEMAQSEGASSLHSCNVSLQISHNSLFDLINLVFPPPREEESLGAIIPFFS